MGDPKAYVDDDPEQMDRLVIGSLLPPMLIPIFGSLLLGFRNKHGRKGTFRI